MVQVREAARSNDVGTGLDLESKRSELSGIVSVPDSFRNIPDGAAG